MRMMRCTLAVSMGALLLVALPGAAVASGHARTIVAFNPSAGELPEGVAVDKTETSSCRSHRSGSSWSSNG
jgi:hypothetical protein